MAFSRKQADSIFGLLSFSSIMYVKEPFKSLG